MAYLVKHLPGLEALTSKSPLPRYPFILLKAKSPKLGIGRVVLAMRLKGESVLCPFQLVVKGLTGSLNTLASEEVVALPPSSSSSLLCVSLSELPLTRTHVITLSAHPGKLG
jgi:hypothetical protein